MFQLTLKSFSKVDINGGQVHDPKTTIKGFSLDEKSNNRHSDLVSGQINFGLGLFSPTLASLQASRNALQQKYRRIQVKMSLKRPEGRGSFLQKFVIKKVESITYIKNLQEYVVQHTVLVKIYLRLSLYPFILISLHAHEVHQECSFQLLGGNKMMNAELANFAKGTKIQIWYQKFWYQKGYQNS